MRRKEESAPLPLRVEEARLSDLARWPRNPKDHDVGALMGSLERFGYVNPILVNAENRTILAGHGRLDALQEGMRSGEDPPSRVRVDDDDWLVPIVVVDLDPSLHEAYVVTDNRLTERGGWDWAMLPDVLGDLSNHGLLVDTGFDADDLDAMIKWRDGEAFPGHKEYDESAAGDVELGACPQCGTEFPLGHARRKWLDDRGPGE